MAGAAEREAAVCEARQTGPIQADCRLWETCRSEASVYPPRCSQLQRSIDSPVPDCVAAHLLQNRPPAIDKLLPLIAAVNRVLTIKIGLNERAHD